MKRRDFIVNTAGSAAAIFLARANAATPCPPLTDSVDSQILCPNVDAELDWQHRISDPGVVWFHDFRTDAEVDAFRWAGGVGNDPNDLGRPGTVRRLTSDGITGSCLELYRPAGSSEGAVWWRPYSALSGNGRSADDPAANGTVQVNAWSPTQGGSQTEQWRRGYYGHQSYHASHPADVFDGTEYYFQARIKMDPERVNQPNGGKLFYFTRADRSLTSQEIVTVSGRTSYGQNYFSMYRSGSPPMAYDTPGGGNQPGNESGFCDWPSEIDHCWAWSGGWDTVMYRIVPGISSNSDTIVQVWAAHPGETSYTKIWDQIDVDLPLDGIEGHGALICSAYMNGLSFSQPIYHRYCQLIFSKNFIPCPQV